MNELNDMKKNVINSYNRRDIVVVEGSGAYVRDENGDKYLDFISGIAVNALGHSNRLITDAINEQSKKLIHVSNLFWNEPQLRLATRLVKEAGADFKSVFFSNSGTEAVEGCLKLMRKFGSKFDAPKRKILYFSGSFHGRTIGALTVTGEPNYRSPYIPSESEVVCLPFNDTEALKNADLSDVCGAVVEVIQGEGGVMSSTREFLTELKKKSVECDFLTAFDEIQCGIGRTGTFFAFQGYGVNPDLFAVAKGLAGGLPIGGIVVNERADMFGHGDHGSTFGGNPLVCAASLKVIETIFDEKLMENVIEMSDVIDAGIMNIINKYAGYIIEIRGKGLLKGVKLSDKITTSALGNACFKNKLLLIGAGDNVMRILPPLNVKKSEVDEFLEKFETSVAEAVINLH